MTRFLIPAAATSALAGPALAHGGAYAHPHDGPHWLWTVGLLAATAAVTYAWRRHT